MRISSKHYTCILCGREAYNGVVCSECTATEINIQKDKAGTITMRQVNYIEYLMTKVSLETWKGIASEVAAWNGDLESLTANQAGFVISKLVSATADQINGR